MSEPTSRFFERRYIKLDEGGENVSGNVVTCDVSRSDLTVKLPEEGWHLLSDEQIDRVLADVGNLVRRAAPFWLRERHIADDSPEWLKARYQSALALGSIDGGAQ